MKRDILFLIVLTLSVVIHSATLHGQVQASKESFYTQAERGVIRLEHDQTEFLYHGE